MAGSYERTPEFRERMSALQKARGYTHSPETRARMSALRKGKKHSPETRAKIAASKLGTAGGAGSSSGYRHSAETRAKMSAMRMRSDAGANAIHTWLRNHYPKRGICDECDRDVGLGNAGTTFAFKHHPHPHTRNREDYRELCRACHRHFDSHLFPQDRKKE